MLRVNVTKLLLLERRAYSASVAELGDNAGRITWRNCLAYTRNHKLLSPTQFRDFYDYMRSMGFEFSWPFEEIDGKLPVGKSCGESYGPKQELQALCMQVIMGDLHESRLSEEFRKDESPAVSTEEFDRMWAQYEDDESLNHNFHREEYKPGRWKYFWEVE